jgi:putative transposase
LFRSALDQDAIAKIRLALNQGQPLGNTRFHSMIERVTGQRREPRPRGRPRKRVAGGAMT